MAARLGHHAIYCASRSEDQPPRQARPAPDAGSGTCCWLFDARLDTTLPALVEHRRKHMAGFYVIDCTSANKLAFGWTPHRNSSASRMVTVRRLVGLRRVLLDKRLPIINKCRKVPDSYTLNFDLLVPVILDTALFSTSSAVQNIDPCYCSGLKKDSLGTNTMAGSPPTSEAAPANNAAPAIISDQTILPASHWQETSVCACCTVPPSGSILTNHPNHHVDTCPRCRSRR